MSTHFKTPDDAAKSVSLAAFGRFADNKQALAAATALTDSKMDKAPAPACWRGEFFLRQSAVIDFAATRGAIFAICVCIVCNEMTV